HGATFRFFLPCEPVRDCVARDRAEPDARTPAGELCLTQDLEALVGELRSAAPADEPAAGRSSLEQAPSTEGGLHVLIADDSPINLDVAAGLLEMMGHKATVVSSGEQALAAVRRQSFDLILMDLEMPEMDGLEATTRIREYEL